MMTIAHCVVINGHYYEVIAQKLYKYGVLNFSKVITRLLVT